MKEGPGKAHHLCSRGLERTGDEFKYSKIKCAEAKGLYNHNTDSRSRMSECDSGSTIEDWSNLLRCLGNSPSISGSREDLNTPSRNCAALQPEVSKASSKSELPVLLVNLGSVLVLFASLFSPVIHRAQRQVHDSLARQTPRRPSTSRGISLTAAFPRSLFIPIDTTIVTASHSLQPGLVSASFNYRVPYG